MKQILTLKPVFQSSLIKYNRYVQQPHRQLINMTTQAHFIWCQLLHISYTFSQQSLVNYLLGKNVFLIQINSQQPPMNIKGYFYLQKQTIVNQFIKQMINKKILYEDKVVIKNRSHKRLFPVKKYAQDRLHRDFPTIQVKDYLKNTIVNRQFIKSNQKNNAKLKENKLDGKLGENQKNQPSRLSMFVKTKSSMPVNIQRKQEQARIKKQKQIQAIQQKRRIQQEQIRKQRQKRQKIIKQRQQKQQKQKKQKQFQQKQRLRNQQIFINQRKKLKQLFKDDPQARQHMIDSSPQINEQEQRKNDQHLDSRQRLKRQIERQKRIRQKKRNPVKPLFTESFTNKILGFQSSQQSQKYNDKRLAVLNKQKNKIQQIQKQRNPQFKTRKKQNHNHNPTKAAKQEKPILQPIQIKKQEKIQQQKKLFPLFNNTNANKTSKSISKNPFNQLKPPLQNPPHNKRKPITPMKRTTSQLQQKILQVQSQRQQFFQLQKNNKPAQLKYLNNNKVYNNNFSHLYLPVHQNHQINLLNRQKPQQPFPKLEIQKAQNSFIFRQSNISCGNQQEQIFDKNMEIENREMLLNRNDGRGRLREWEKQRQRQISGKRQRQVRQIQTQQYCRQRQLLIQRQKQRQIQIQKQQQRQQWTQRQRYSSGRIETTKTNYNIFKNVKKSDECLNKSRQQQWRQKQFKRSQRSIKQTDNKSFNSIIKKSQKQRQKEKQRQTLSNNNSSKHIRDNIFAKSPKQNMFNSPYFNSKQPRRSTITIPAHNTSTITIKSINKKSTQPHNKPIQKDIRQMITLKRDHNQIKFNPKQQQQQQTCQLQQTITMLKRPQPPALHSQMSSFQELSYYLYRKQQVFVPKKKSQQKQKTPSTIHKKYLLETTFKPQTQIKPQYRSRQPQQFVQNKFFASKQTEQQQQCSNTKTLAIARTNGMQPRSNYKNGYGNYNSSKRIDYYKSMIDSNNNRRNDHIDINGPQKNRKIHHNPDQTKTPITKSMIINKPPLIAQYQTKFCKYITKYNTNKYSESSFVKPPQHQNNNKNIQKKNKKRCNKNKNKLDGDDGDGDNQKNRNRLLMKNDKKGNFNRRYGRENMGDDNSKGQLLQPPHEEQLLGQTITTPEPKTKNKKVGRQDLSFQWIDKLQNRRKEIERKKNQQQDQQKNWKKQPNLQYTINYDNIISIDNSSPQQQSPKKKLDSFVQQIIESFYQENKNKKNRGK